MKKALTKFSKWKSCLMFALFLAMLLPTTSKAYTGKEDLFSTGQKQAGLVEKERGETVFGIDIQTGETAFLLSENGNRGEDANEKGRHNSIWGVADLVQEYTGKAVKPTVKIYDGNRQLREKVHYTLSYKKNINAYNVAEGEAGFEADKAPYILLKMKGEYTKSVKIYFTIEPLDISDASGIPDNIAISKTGKSVNPKNLLKLQYGSKKLKYNKDYLFENITELQNTSTGQLKLKGVGNYTGELLIDCITTEDAGLIPMDQVKVKGIKNLNYNNGDPVTQSNMKVSYKKDMLTESPDAQSGDYTLAYRNHVAAGVAELVLTGTGTDSDGDGLSYIGQKVVLFTIKGEPLSKAKIGGLAKAYDYTGKPLEPEFTITVGGQTLTEGKDYTTEYTNNINKGTASITVKSSEKTGYTGSKTFKFKINPGSNLTVSFNGLADEKDVITTAYTKLGATPEVSVYDGERLLEEKLDYTVQYKNNKKVAEAASSKAPTVVIKGKGNYTGTFTKPFNIKGSALSEESGIRVQAADKEVSTKQGGYITKITIFDSDNGKLSKKDYDSKNITYTLIEKLQDGKPVSANEVLGKTDIIPEGSKIRVDIKGMNNYPGEISAEYRILGKGKDISKSKAKVFEVEYTGREVTVSENQLINSSITLPSQGTLTLGEDFVIVEDSYRKNVNPGTATVTIQGIGELGGFKDIKFKIVKKNIENHWIGILGDLTDDSEGGSDIINPDHPNEPGSGSDNDGPGQGGNEPGGSGSDNDGPGQGGNEPGGSGSDNDGPGQGGNEPGGSGSDNDGPGQGGNEPGGSGDEPGGEDEPDVPGDSDTITSPIDLKDIASVKVYYQGKEVEGIDVSDDLPDDSKLTDYYLEITPAYAPKLYVNVKRFIEENGKVYAEGDVSDFVTYRKTVSGLDMEEKAIFEVPVVSTSAETPAIKSAEQFIEDIKSNLGDTHVLTENLDASGLNISDAAYITSDFTGTISGNGFTIYGLEKPLFNKISNGTVRDIIFKEANINLGAAKGILASNIENNSTVENVTFEDSTLISTGSSVGFVGGTVKNTKIKNVNVVNCTIQGNNTIGAIIGDAGNGAVMENIFVFKTSMKGTQSGNNNGTRVAGVTGWLNSAASIKNAYVNVTIDVPGNAGSGGLIGAPQSNAGSIQNAIGICNGKGMQVAGFDAALNSAQNVYQLSGASNKNTATGLKEVEAVTKDFFLTQLNLGEEQWKILDADNTALVAGSILQSVPEYKKENERSYINLMKLAPFLNTEAVVQMGNALTNENLNHKTIQAIYPFNKEDELVQALKSNDADSISKIKVVYTDDTFETLNVTYETTAGNMVAVYYIEDDSIPYHFDGYIIQEDSAIISHIVETANTYDYDTHIKAAVGTEDIRLYKEVYDTGIKARVQETAELFAATRYNYSISNHHLETNMKARVQEELPGLLYVYTYFGKSYNFDIGGINIANLLTFTPEKLSKEITTDYLLEQLKAGQRNMNETYDKYSKMIASKTGKQIYPQLEFFIRLSGMDDYNDWFIENWNGHVAEQAPIGYEYTPMLRWRIWDNITQKTGGHALLLHVLSMPEEIQPQIAVISTSSQLLFTDINIYYADPNSQENRDNFYKRIDSFATNHGRYYGTSLGFVENGEESLNQDFCIGYDTIRQYMNPAFKGAQNRFGAEAPMVKYVQEPRGQIYDTTAGAVANGSYLWYGVDKMLNDFGLFTHENAHNQDSDYFYDGAGRRNGVSGEYSSEGYLTQNSKQQGWDGMFTLNLIHEFDVEDNVITNFTYERINTKEKIHDYYRDLFDVWYAANAMYGEAFIKAPDSVKEKVNKKATPEYSNGNTMTTYTTGYWSDVMVNWKMDTVADLCDIQIAVRSTDPSDSGYTPELFWPVTWFTPSNPTGVTDSLTFKIMGYDMLGYAGWDQGFVAWSSGKYKTGDGEVKSVRTDDEIIKGITGYETMGDYKKARLTEASLKVKQSPYFDSEQMKEVIGAAYGAEVDRLGYNIMLGVKKVFTHAIKRVTDDFTNGNIYEASTNIHEVGTAEELIKIVNETCATTGVMVKLTSDIDFSDVEVDGNTYMTRIFGIIDGNGYKITGLKKPLFERMRYTMVRNIELEGESEVLLANTSSFSLVHHSDFESGKTLIKNGGKDQVVFTYFMNMQK